MVCCCSQRVILPCLELLVQGTASCVVAAWSSQPIILTAFMSLMQTPLHRRRTPVVFLQITTGCVFLDATIVHRPTVDMTQPSASNWVCRGSMHNTGHHCCTLSCQNNAQYHTCQPLYLCLEGINKVPKSLFITLNITAFGRKRSVF